MCFSPTHPSISRTSTARRRSMSIIIETQRGKRKLNYEGHLYVYSSISKDQSTETWRCHRKNNRALKCTASLHRHVASGEVMVLGIHSDMPDAAAVEAAQRKTSLKRRAVETVETPQQIIAKIRVNSSLAAQGKLEGNRALARIVQRCRNRCGAPPTQYSSVAEICIPEEYRMYESAPGNSERFLLGDSGSDPDDPDPHRILIFGRESTGASIEEIRKIYVDGTFSLKPKMFAQVFVILGERQETEESPRSVTPLCYVLMQDKTEDSYLKVSSS